MNVFIISPGRTATTTIANAFSCLPGYTSGHETKVKYLGDERVDYANNHVECDNRLAWFLPRLTSKYSNDGLLVILNRDREKIAASYNKRWYKINIMKAYSQGILMRDFTENNADVCRDYVRSVNEQLAFAKSHWKKCITIELEDIDKGVDQIVEFMGMPECASDVKMYIKDNHDNENKMPPYLKGSIIKHGLRSIYWDMRKW